MPVVIWRYCEFRTVDVLLPRATCALLLIKVQRRVNVPCCFKHWRCVAICRFVFAYLMCGLHVSCVRRRLCLSKFSVN